MSKGGGSQSTTTKTKAKPWAPAVPYVKDIMGQAQNLYANYRPQPFPGSTVADMSPEMKAALQAMWDRASTGNPLLGQGQNLTSNVMAGAGGVPQSSFDFLTGMTNWQNPALPIAGGDVAQSWVDNPALAGEAFGAGGGFLGANPYLDATYARGARGLTDAWNNVQAPGIDASADLAGRPGSRAQAGAYDDSLYGLGNALSDLSNKIYGGDYESERARMLQSQGLLSDTWNQQLAGQRAATTNLAQIAEAARSGGVNAATAAGNLGIADTGQRLQAAGMAPGLSDADYSDIMKMMGVGGALDARSQQQLQGLIDSWNQSQQTPYTALNNYAQVLTPFLFPGQTQTSSGGASNTAANVVGGVAGLGSLASGLGTLLPFLWSSRTLKEDLQVVEDEEILAKLARLPVMTWRYIGEDVRHIGPMAQDFREIFGVGDGVTIAVVDAIGVLTAAARAMERRVAASRSVA